MHNKFFDRLDRKVADDIQRVGWSAMGVGAGAGFPTFTYSAGFQMTAAAPEMITIGLPPAIAHAFLAIIYTQAKRGQIYQHGDVTDSLAEGYQSAFVAVTPEYRAQYMTMTTRYYEMLGQPWSALQLVWPDVHGQWPWMPGFIGHQPVLGPVPTQLNNRDT